MKHAAIIAVGLALLAACEAQRVSDTYVTPEEVPALVSAFESAAHSQGRQLLQDPGYYYGGYDESGNGGYYGGYGEAMPYEGRSMLEQQDAGAQRGVVPALEGVCYCHYDVEFNSWAMAEDVCKDALYAKCKADSRLSCEWLDAYYGASMTSSRVGFGLPHEKEIAAFLFEDCVAKPPCGCSDMRFDGNDDAAISYACCRDLKTACRRPFAGVSCEQVDSYCTGDQPSPTLAQWVQHSLWHSQCAAYNGRPYDFMTLNEMTAVAQAARGELDGSDMLSNAMIADAVGEEDGEQEVHMLPLAMLAVAGGVLAVAVAGVAMALRSRSPVDEDIVAPLVGQAPARLGGQRSSERGTSGLLPPTPAPSRGPSRSASQSSLHE